MCAVNRPFVSLLSYQSVLIIATTLEGPTMSSNQPDEIEISLEDDADLELTTVDIDSEELPLEFSVDGVIRDLDSGVMDDLQGRDLEPVAVRFRLLNGGE